MEAYHLIHYDCLGVNSSYGYELIILNLIKKE